MYRKAVNRGIKWARQRYAAFANAADAVDAILTPPTLPDPPVHNYNNLLRSNTLGNFKELVRLVTIDPAMLYFLNGYLNEASAPDENFARELQELFTVGKESANTYTEDDVREAARVLTGWRVNSTTGTSFFYEPSHDNGDKTFSSFYNNELLMLLGQPPNVAGWPPFRQSPGYHRNWISGATMRSRSVFTDVLSLYSFNGGNTRREGFEPYPLPTE